MMLNISFNRGLHELTESGRWYIVQYNICFKGSNTHTQKSLEWDAVAAVDKEILNVFYLCFCCSSFCYVVKHLSDLLI